MDLSAKKLRDSYFTMLLEDAAQENNLFGQEDTVYVWNLTPTQVFEEVKSWPKKFIVKSTKFLSTIIKAAKAEVWRFQKL